MSLFLETIRFENGRFDNLPFHQQRLENTLAEVFNETNNIPSLENYLSDTLKKLKYDENRLYKCRVVYDREIKSVEFIPYQLPEITSLKLIAAGEIDYHLKYLERGVLNNLYAQRGQTGDVLIIKNGLITDTSFANILFFNGRQWVTPAVPLLKGTRRQQLLADEKIITAGIRPGDLHYFTKARLINAMIRFEDEADVDIDRIGFYAS